jgi:hypothetical protein
MKNKILVTQGNGMFAEEEWIRPEVADNEIAVKSIMTGVCRSDIDMMQGNFGPLPVHMQGHEGLGQIIEVGKDMLGINVGDFVATRGEPAYADSYNVKNGEFVIVPEASPKYILEPVACGINLVIHACREIQLRANTGKRILLLGSGFLAWVAYNTLLEFHFNCDIVVVGNSNKDIWGDALSPSYEGTFDVVIDLSNRTDVFDKPILNTNALVILGSQKQITTDFANLLWKACTIVFPSPRTDSFLTCMMLGEKWITSGKLVVDKFWTRSYNRETEWQNAFLDGANRPANYSRGYITWV